jgi:hypothetical protein
VDGDPGRTYGDMAMSEKPAHSSRDSADGLWWSIEVLTGAFSADH